MASKRSYKINLFQRLFLPQVALLWTIIGMLVWYAISNEQEVRRSIYQNQLRNVNATILDAYEHGIDLQQTLSFIQDYNSNTLLNDVRVTIYNVNDEPLAHVGDLILLEDSNHNEIPEFGLEEKDGEVNNVRPNLISQTESMFSLMTSNDGEIRTIAAVPYSPSVIRALGYNTIIWVFVLVLGVVATMVIWLFCARVSRSVNTLHELARRAAEGKEINPHQVRLSHDEIGDVTREVIRLYVDKDHATKRLEHEHQVALRANEEKARVKRQTANNLNHEIKTPVGVIKGYIDTILSDPDMPEQLRMDFLRKAQEHTDRLTQLLKDVSSITRLEEGASQVEVTDFDFHDLIYAIASDLEVSDIAGNLAFDWDIPFDTNVRGNYTLLNNAIINLVRNAAKYSKGTRITLDVIAQDSKFYTFRFADDGTGVGEQHIPHLFERFYRVDEGRARKSGGTGLGLPIVKSTFEALGGKIRVRNASPHGLEFIFTLPKSNT
ncbi:MAG: HAMP domain-containing histidine kinase [Bacteroides sp.]|nr:HAMP domain-containing histidine kinase [Bacteroides sp.]MCM1379096.1 HAMP domain-containing histidine kinase [Bacteroides sp.]MCM1445794.1 HAMP domain-containing histidine kinase [Prevotella sp.]